MKINAILARVRDQRIIDCIVLPLHRGPTVTPFFFFSLPIFTLTITGCNLCNLYNVRGCTTFFVHAGRIFIKRSILRSRMIYRRNLARYARSPSRICTRGRIAHVPARESFRSWSVSSFQPSSRSGSSREV